MPRSDPTSGKKEMVMVIMSDDYGDDGDGDGDNSNDGGGGDNCSDKDSDSDCEDNYDKIDVVVLINGYSRSLLLMNALYSNRKVNKCQR